MHADERIPILLVDGGQDALESLRDAVDETVYRPVSAASEAEALERLGESADFAAVVIGTQSAGRGCETARAIRRYPKLDRVPILLVGVDLHDVPAEGIDCADFVTAAVAPNLIASKLTIFADLYRARRDVQRMLATLHDRAGELNRSHEQLRVIAENASDMITVVDRLGRRLYASPSFRALFGEQIAQGTDSFSLIHPDDRSEVRRIFREALESGQGRRAEYRFVLGDGTVRHIESASNPVRGEDGRVSSVVVISRDVTERHEMERRLRRMAHHDALTGLPNRAQLLERLGRSIAFARRHQSRFAVMFIDLDRFKIINDTLGHALGDATLREVARRLADQLRDVDTLARIGGDEFVAVIEETASDADAEQVARKLIAAVDPPMIIDEHELKVGASIGISVFPEHGTSTEDLLRCADIALYRTKAAGRNQFRFYGAEMDIEANQRRSLQASLRRAIDHSEFVLHYQPLISLQTNLVAGAEALVRWRHPTLGLLAPNRFLPAAEDMGLIDAIGEWVLREACEQQARWGDALGGPIAVNLSARQFHNPGLADVVSRSLAASGLAPNGLELEITETSMMEDAVETVETLRGLSAMGVRLSIDDFGTGYSSLSYLKRFPVHKLKIDRSFVRDLTVDDDDATVTRAMLALARHFRLEVCAEGVESPEQAAFLREAGCDVAQGFCFCKPLPPAQFGHWLAAWQAGRAGRGG